MFERSTLTKCFGSGITLGDGHHVGPLGTNIGVLQSVTDKSSFFLIHGFDRVGARLRRGADRRSINVSFAGMGLVVEVLPWVFVNNAPAWIIIRRYFFERITPTSCCGSAITLVYGHPVGSLGTSIAALRAETVKLRFRVIMCPGGGRRRRRRLRRADWTDT